MKDEIMKGVVWMTTDGIKDADMAYEYAVDAKEAGKPELAAMFVEDAKYRLGKVKEWYERASFVGLDCCYCLFDHFVCEFHFVVLLDFIGCFPLSL